MQPVSCCLEGHAAQYNCRISGKDQHMYCILAHQVLICLRSEIKRLRYTAHSFKCGQHTNIMVHFIMASKEIDPQAVWVKIMAKKVSYFKKAGFYHCQKSDSLKQLRNTSFGLNFYGNHYLIMFHSFWSAIHQSYKGVSLTMCTFIFQGLMFFFKSCLHNLFIIFSNSFF